MISNARMYAVSTSVERAWQALMERVARRAAINLEYHEHRAPSPISALWARADCGCVFMCGLPYITADVRPRLLAAPVPSLSRYGASPVYFTEFLTRADAGIDTLEHSFGGRLACMRPESNSGHNAPRLHLLSRAAPGVGALYRPTATPTPTPGEVIEAVRGGQAEVGVVDSYWLDLLRLHEPERLAPLKTLAVSQASPIPVLVASRGVGDGTVARLRSALLELHLEADASATLASLGLLRFTAVEETDYLVLPEQARRAEAAGFALTAPAPGTCS
jgi:ABC-type phosphate/phosphonate transport system substrate-binding protein